MTTQFGRGGARLAAGQAGHGDDPVLAEPVGQPDGAADVLGVLVADAGLGCSGLPLQFSPAIETPVPSKIAEVVVAGGVADQDVVEGGDVHGGQEPAGVDLDAGQAEVGDDLQGLGQRTVVQDRVVDAELHSVTFFPLLQGGLGDRGEQFHVVHALVEGGAAGQGLCFAEAGDLFEERPGLVGEGVVLAEADARGRPWPGRRRGRGGPGRG